MAEQIRIRRALISVSDKSGLEAFAQALVTMGVELISTGGTAATLAKFGITSTPIEQVTGFPEMMDGRVKTLHPKVHGALLGVRSNPEHVAAMATHGIAPIDLVCVNLYPFEETASRPGVHQEEAIEQIDIGGPSMLRSAAKNFESVTVLTSPTQYAQVLAEMRSHAGSTTRALRRECAAAVFARTAAYDAAIAAFMADTATDAAAPFPAKLAITYTLSQELRYGENPHQRGAVYADTAAAESSVVGARLLHGKPLSYNNLLDAAAALELLQDLHTQCAPKHAATAAHAAAAHTACAVIKHTNPCGAALGNSTHTAFERAWSGDPLAAFGGIVAFSQRLDVATAQAMATGERFLEVVLAPDYEPEALAILQARWKNVRLLETGPLRLPERASFSIRSIPGGMLLQERDLHPIHGEAFKHAAGPAPDAAMRVDAGMLFVVAKHLKSNAVCIGAGGALFGAGAGQMDRVASCRNAIEKAQRALSSLPAGTRPVAASDAFFPFADGPALLAEAGIRCIVHPGGSVRDQETFALCDARGITCLLTGSRHFRH